MEQLAAEMKNQRLLVESMAERLDALEPARADTHAASPHGGGPAEKPAGDAAPSSSPTAEEPPLAEPMKLAIVVQRYGLDDQRRGRAGTRGTSPSGWPGTPMSRS